MVEGGKVGNLTEAGMAVIVLIKSMCCQEGTDALVDAKNKFESYED